MSNFWLGVFLLATIGKIVMVVLSTVLYWN